MSETAFVLTEIPFHGDTLLAGKDGDQILVDPKPVCEQFGLDWPSQYTKLVKSFDEGGWATIVKITTVAADGKEREQSLITLETFLMWMATISLTRVDAFYRDKLRLYQKEAGMALRKRLEREGVVTVHVMCTVDARGVLQQTSPMSQLNIRRLSQVHLSWQRSRAN